MSCRSLLVNRKELDCNGPLILTPSTTSIEGKFYLTCTTTEEKHDCVCSPTRDFNVTTCVPGEKDSNACPVSVSNPGNSCTITWKGKYTDSLNVLPLSCNRVLVSPSCKTKCEWNTNGTVQCKRQITCSASPGPVSTTPGNVCSNVQSDVVTTTKTTAKDTGPGTTVLALGVVAGLTFIALVIALVVLYFAFRRHRKRNSPTNNDYTDINVRDVDNTAYESSVEIPNQYERLENERLNGKDPKSGLYMDLEYTTTTQSNQTPQQYGLDSIYNSIDEYEPNGDQGYAQTNDLPHRSQEMAKPVDIPVTSADYFVLEKQQEEKSSRRPTADLNQTENYFVLDKDENRVSSDLTDNDTDSRIVNANKADTHSMLEEQTNKQSNENIPPDNYFLLEKENEINTKEGTVDNDTYNTLNSDINNEKDETTEDDYSHARGASSSHENSTRATTMEENVEDYDQLFQKPNNNVVYDADNDYDHIHNGDPLTSL